MLIHTAINSERSRELLLSLERVELGHSDCTLVLSRLECAEVMLELISRAVELILNWCLVSKRHLGQFMDRRRLKTISRTGIHDARVVRHSIRVNSIRQLAHHALLLK